MYTLVELKNDAERRRDFFETLRHFDDFKKFKNACDLEDVNYLLADFLEISSAYELIEEEKEEFENGQKILGYYEVEVGIYKNLKLCVEETVVDDEYTTKYVGFDF